MRKTNFYNDFMKSLSDNFIKHNDNSNKKNRLNLLVKMHHRLDQDDLPKSSKWKKYELKLKRVLKKKGNAYLVDKLVDYAWDSLKVYRSRFHWDIDQLEVDFGDNQVTTIDVPISN